MFVRVDPHRWVHHLPFRCFYFRNFDAFLGGSMGQHLYCKSLRTKKTHTKTTYMDKCAPKIVACEQKTDAKHVRQLAYMWRTFR